MMAGWRAILLNRFVLVPGAIVLAIVLWNIYVATHNNGLLTGRVTNSAGRPVAQATVSLWVYNFTTYEEKQRVKTDADGVFRFTDNPRTGSRSAPTSSASAAPGASRSFSTSGARTGRSTRRFVWPARVDESVLRPIASVAECYRIELAPFS